MATNPLASVTAHHQEMAARRGPGRGRALVLTFTIAAAGFAMFAATRVVHAGAPPPPMLPTSCDKNDLVVSAGGGRFTCERPQPALRLAGCSEGDVVVTDAFGGLRCQRGTGSSSSTSRALLPTCSSGEVLVSEGGGSWRCRQSPMPSCSSGEILVSEGSGSWRCRPQTLLPSCSSGEILVSQGSGSWRCERR